MNQKREEAEPVGRFLSLEQYDYFSIEISPEKVSIKGKGENYRLSLRQSPRKREVMNERGEAIAVKMCNGYKRYTPQAVILRGMNMTIRRGTIYGLLGPSGCGKTTLLSCIVGRQTLDSGTLDLVFTRRKQIGYMPQDIALNTEMTIIEVFMYYGRLYEMKSEQLARRAEEQIKFLELPPRDRKIGNCSGGQQRRISMAVTLLHDPELLILDEPTVGVDPLLCHKIWEVFVDLVNVKGKTIVITTHYIEEAKAAHTIGLMRGGVLLAEESPQSLMVRFECETLEDVFLQLSKKQGDDSKFTGVYPPIQDLNASLSQNQSLWNATRFKAQLRKNLIWTYRNIPVTLFVCLVPVISMAIACSVDISHMILNPIGLYSRSPHDCGLTGNHTYIRSCLHISDFYCRYREILGSRYPVMEYDDEGSAMYDGKRGRVIAIVYFSHNFTNSTMERIEKQMSSSNKAIEDSTVYVTTDMSNFVSAFRITMEIYTALQDLLKEICVQCGIDERFTKMPIEFMDPVFGKGANDVTSMLPGLLCPFVFYMTFVYTSTAIMMEKQSGLLERYQIAGLTMPEVLVAQALIQMVILNVQTVSLFLVIYGLFDNLMEGNVIAAYFILVLSELFGMTYGMIMALWMKDESALTYAGIGSMLATFGFCGCFWPIEGQHALIRISGKFVPLTWAAKSFANIAARGWGLNDVRVLSGFLLPICGSLGFLLLTWFLMRRKIIQV